MPAGPRWSLAVNVRTERDSATVNSMNATQSAPDFAGLLLERWAVVSRSSVAAEEPVGGFAALYPVLTLLAESGTCQRIYAIDGAGGAQFALPGVVDEIRSYVADSHVGNTHVGNTHSTNSRRSDDVIVMSAVDPANPYGAILPWPDHPSGDPSMRASRRAGSLVALIDGRLRAWLDPSGSSLVTWGGIESHELRSHDERVHLLRSLATARVRMTERSRALLTNIDGASIVGAPHRDSAGSISAGSMSAGSMWVSAAKAAGLAEAPRGWRWPTDA